MIVVDTNIIACLVFPGNCTQSVESLHEFDPHWEVPFLWRSEFLNVVTLHLRKNLINYLEALDAIEKGIKLIGAREHEVSAFAAMEFVHHSTCSPYDCEFLALADRLKVNLVTYNKEILKTFPMLASRPEEYIKKQHD